MGARTGKMVLERFRNEQPEIWHRGKKIINVVDEPGFYNGIRGLASLYDYQWEKKEIMLRESLDTGDLVNRSYDIPRSVEELKSLGDAMYCAAEHSKGMMGREPSYVNRIMSTLSGSADFLSNNGRAYSNNARSHHKFIRENDLSSTHSLSGIYSR